MSEDVRQDVVPKAGIGVALASMVVIALAAALSWWGTQSVDPKPETAPANEFSAERAHKHLLEMCRETHPTGSQAAKRVREYLVSTIDSMGYHAEVQKAIVPSRTNRLPYELRYVENVIVYIPGTDSTGLYLNMAHYDSVPYGLGASDDGAGCAAMLEVLRALKEYPPLKNDVAFLFTDGEEAGLLGPRGFMQHPLYQDLKLVLNYEARGYYGPSMMFELSDENGWIIDQVAAAAPAPVASSIMFDAADRMPTTTDYEVFRRAGIPGMGLAYVGGIEYYHTKNDSPEKISLGSLQHHGEYGLPLALHFGNIALDNVRAPNQVYFTLWPGRLVKYPARYIPMFAALTILAVASTLLIGKWRDVLCLRRTLLGAGAHLIASLCAALLVAGVMFAGWMLQEEYVVYSTWWYYAGFVCVTVAIYAGVLRAVRGPLGVVNLAAGALLCWIPLMLAVCAYFPGGSYFATWPVLGSALGLLAVLAVGDRAPGLTVAAVLAACIVPLIILVPLQYMSVTGMTIVPAPFWMLMLCMELGLLLIPLHWAMGERGVWMPALGTGLALPILAAALFGLRFTETTPKMNHLCYGMNCTTNEAFWISQDKQLDDWLRNFFSDVNDRQSVDEFVYGFGGKALKAAAPLTDAPQPEVDVLSDASEGGKRTLRLKVRSPRKAARIDIALAPGTQVYGATLQGNPLGGASGEPQVGEGEAWRARYQGLPYDGLDLMLVVDDGVPLDLAVREESFGVLPPVPGVDAPKRPANMVTENNVKRFWDGIFTFRSNVFYTVKHFSL
ncbi:MAG: M20/M25/M40 family metallo-hydrolase [Candidatus Hydrogenedens sp.]|nr:M20/M25/M40 family metallo-hydrolase [Candidatus Hydrogenedens sp.]